MTLERIAADSTDEYKPVAPPIKNMVIIAIIVGNAPPYKGQLCPIRRVDG
jgi:hypothetical protein